MPSAWSAFFHKLTAVAAAAVLVASALAFSPPAAAQTQPFTDTASDAYYSDAVAALAGRALFEGTECVEGMLCPETSMDRKTMAVWTVRALDGTDPAQASGDRFADVDSGSFHAPFIERLAELGVTSGCGDGTTFCPDAIVTRAEMAVFLTRAFNLDPGPDPGFSDVPSGAWYYNQAAALAASGITAGCGDGTTFCPNQHTTRAQMATFLARALGLVDKPTPTPPTATTYKDLAGGIGHMCVLLTDGDVTCWLGVSLLQDSSIQAPEGSYKSIHAGGAITCAIRTDDTIICWRFRHYRWSFSGHIEVVQNVPQGSYKTIAVSEATIFLVSEGHACAIGTDDTITCWGDNQFGQTDAPAGTYKTIAVSEGHACAIGTDDTITCWGDNQFGQTDAPAGTYKSIVANSLYACAIGTDDTITCWGDNQFGQTDAPAGTYKSIVANSLYACAIGTDDTITCWGDNQFGQTDAPAGTFRNVVVHGGFVPPHACAIGTDDTITCWGGNFSGQTDAPAGTYKTIAASEGRTCAIGTDDTITCWPLSTLSDRGAGG